MPAGGEIFVAGQYTCTYGGVATGIYEGDGGVPTISVTTHGEAINNTDAYGKTLIDAIHQGADWEFMGTLLEWKAGSKSALWPFDATIPLLGVIARLYYAMSSSFVMTAVTGTPAQVGGDPLTLTADKAIVPPGFNTRIPFGPTLRKFPLRLALLPYGNGAQGVISFFMT